MHRVSGDILTYELDGNFLLGRNELGVAGQAYLVKFYYKRTQAEASRIRRPEGLENEQTSIFMRVNIHR